MQESSIQIDAIILMNSRADSNGKYTFLLQFTILLSNSRAFWRWFTISIIVAITFKGEKSICSKFNL